MPSARLTATLNGKSVSADFAKPPNAADTQRTLRVPNLGLTPDRANGTKLCIKVRSRVAHGAFAGSHAGPKACLTARLASRGAVLPRSMFR